MRTWGFSPSAEDLEKVAAALALYRDGWASIRPPFDAAFDGSMADVEALDYIDYEGIDIRRAGLEPAALVCGEVLRRVAGLQWVVSYRGDWVVATAEEAPRGVAICPLARLHEAECGNGGGRGLGKHKWFIQQAAFECLPAFDSEERRRAVYGLFERPGPYLDLVREALAPWPARDPAPRRRRRR